MRAALIAVHLIPLTLLSTSLYGQAAATGGRGSVRGTVTAQGRPLAGVLVMRLGSGDSTRSDSLGRYVLSGLGAGHHIFEIRKRGFSPLEAEITFPSDTITVQADIPMEPATGADPLLVQKLDREGFSERRRRASVRDRVTFLGPQEIEEKEAVRVSQLFESVPDVTVRFERGISVLYGGDGHCVMYVWIEHQYIDNAFPPAGSTAPSSRQASSATHYTGLDDLIPLGQIGAVEIYPRPSQVPQDYQRSSQDVAARSRGRDFETRSAECGAVIFWTK